MIGHYSLSLLATLFLRYTTYVHQSVQQFILRISYPSVPFYILNSCLQLLFPQIVIPLETVRTAFHRRSNRSTIQRHFTHNAAMYTQIRYDRHHVFGHKPCEIFCRYIFTFYTVWVCIFFFYFFFISSFATQLRVTQLWIRCMAYTLSHIIQTNWISLLGNLARQVVQASATRVGCPIFAVYKVAFILHKNNWTYEHVLLQKE